MYSPQKTKTKKTLLGYYYWFDKLGNALYFI